MFSSLKRALVAAHICTISLTLIPAVSQAAGGICLSVAGKVRLDPETSCKIATLYPGPTYLGVLGVPNACFSLQLTGLGVMAKGNAGLTSEGMVTFYGGEAPTPAMVIEQGLPPIPNEFGFAETRRFVTARSVVSLPGGKLYTADAGVLGLGISTEQLIITGGDGFYKNASGILFATGNLIGNWGDYNGKICYPALNPPPPPAG